MGHMDDKVFSTSGFFNSLSLPSKPPDLRASPSAAQAHLQRLSQSVSKALHGAHPRRPRPGTANKYGNSVFNAASSYSVAYITWQTFKSASCILRRRSQRTSQVTSLSPAMKKKELISLDPCRPVTPTNTLATSQQSCSPESAPLEQSASPLRWSILVHRCRR